MGLVVLLADGRVEIVGLQPFISPLLGFFLGHAVAILKFSSQCFFFAGNHFKVVIGKFSPLLLCSALQLLPFSSHLFSIHKDFYSFFWRANKAQPGYFEQSVCQWPHIRDLASPPPEKEGISSGFASKNSPVTALYSP